MSSSPHTIVVGLGAFGSAALDALAARDVRVLGLDRFDPPHTLGSSHGRTRIIREAYFENPFYVPLVRRAYAGWEALEADVGESLLHPCGGLMVGREEGILVRGTLASAREHAISHELLDASELRRRLPDLRAPDDHVGVLEARAGALMVEPCIRALLARARERGAELRTGERVTAWEADGGGVTVVTDRDTYQAEVLVLAAGPWMGELLGPEAATRIRVERQVCLWVDAQFPPGWPVVVWEPGDDRILYTVPDLGDGFKAGLHHGGPEADPDRVERTVTHSEEERILALLARLIPGAGAPILDRSVCLYTNTPDHHFLLGRHPDHPRVVLAGGGSGHGFKFAPVIGEMVAHLALADDDEAVDPSDPGLAIPPAFAPARLLESSRNPAS